MFLFDILRNLYIFVVRKYHKYINKMTIDELKLLLDRTAADRDNLSGQYKQTISQTEVLKQENFALKDYINKMAHYQQQFMNATQSIRQNS